MRYNLLLLSIFWAAGPVEAQMFSPDYDTCAEQQSTLAIADCLTRKTTVWDDRLNTAYKSLIGQVDPGQSAALQAAQRLWIQFRDQNCAFYGAQEGSLRQIMAAECLRSMTKDRANELSTAMKFE